MTHASVEIQELDMEAEGTALATEMETKMLGRGTEGRRSDAVPEGSTESTNHRPDVKEMMNWISKEKPAEFTIYKVHEHVRSISVKAYEPELISIGPYHRGKENLRMMEGHKYRYLHSLLQVDKEDLERLRSAIKAKEPEARKCYAEGVKLSEDDFVDMLVLDGCFIIVLVQKYSEKDPAVMQSNDPIFSMEWIMESLQRDLILFENQVPFFVPRDLFKLITNDEEQKQLELEDLLVNFFKSLFYSTRDVLTVLDPNQLPRHLLELIHQSFTSLSLWYDSPEKEENDEKPKRKGMAMINTASQLTGANVRFERDDKLPLLKFNFTKGTIKMAKLTIEYRTESIYRNLIAYELYFCQGTATNLVTDYVKLLDNLINSSKDVEILSKKGIIENWLGDDEVVANMFNRLTESVLTGPGKSSRYEELFNDINRYYSNRTNKWMAKLKRNHLNSPWTVIPIVAGIVLLVLTAAQTVFSVLQVVLKP